MEGRMHEHGPLCTSVPFVTFDESGCVVVVVCGLVWCGDTVRVRVRLVSSRGLYDCVLIFFSCMFSGLCF